MNTQTITLRTVDVLSDEDIDSRKDWLDARQHVLDRGEEPRRVRDQLTPQCCAAKWAKIEEESVFDDRADTVMRAELLNRRDPSFLKCSGYHLLGLVGVPLILAVCLLLQLHKLPNSSLSYSLLNATVSILFNFSSSALLKAFSFLISLLGFSRWFTSSGNNVAN